MFRGCGRALSRACGHDVDDQVVQVLYVYGVGSGNEGGVLCILLGFAKLMHGVWRCKGTWALQNQTASIADSYLYPIIVTSY